MSLDTPLCPILWFGFPFIHCHCCCANVRSHYYLQKAKKKPIDKKTPKDLGIDISPRIEILSVQEPAKREAGAKVKDVDELLTKLKELGRI